MKYVTDNHTLFYERKNAYNRYFMKVLDDVKSHTFHMDLDYLPFNISINIT